MQSLTGILQEKTEMETSTTLILIKMDMKQKENANMSIYFKIIMRRLQTQHGKIG